MSLVSRRPFAPVQPRRGLSREEAAGYIGIGPALFDRMVKQGQMPGPKYAGSRKLWDVRALDLAFDALPGEGVSLQGYDGSNEWDEVLR